METTEIFDRPKSDTVDAFVGIEAKRQTSGVDAALSNIEIPTSDVVGGRELTSNIPQGLDLGTDQNEDLNTEGPITSSESREKALLSRPIDKLNSETMDQDTALDTQVAAEASKDLSSSAAPADDNHELRRLRDLVFASRGSRSNLPPGWDDEAVEQSKVESVKQSKPVASASAPTVQTVEIQDKTTEEAAQKMLQRAIDMVGQFASDSDSDSDSNSDDSDTDGASSSASRSSTSLPVKKGTRKRQVQARELGSDDEDDGAAAHGPTTKNEVMEPTVDLPPYTVVPMEKEIRPLGKIHSIVDCVVVVAQDVGKAPGQQSQQEGGLHHGYRQAPIDMHGRRGEEEGEYSVLDTGSLLVFSDRNVLGVVYETFGSVLSPLYALRYTSASHVNKDMIQIGKPVYYVPSDSTYVLTRALRALGKGSDASNLWDEEVGEDEREFSDDEAEAEHKRNAKSARGKGRKRSHPEDRQGNAGVGGHSGTNRPVKHSLPMRPVTAHVHRDAANNHQTMALPYDDDNDTESNVARQPIHVQPTMYSPVVRPSPNSAASSHDAYAMWAYQQQQQQQQHPGSATLHYPQHPSSSYSTQQPSSTNDYYDPQQPLLRQSPLSPWPPHPTQ